MSATVIELNHISLTKFGAGAMTIDELIKILEQKKEQIGRGNVPVMINSGTRDSKHIQSNGVGFIPQLVSETYLIIEG